MHAANLVLRFLVELVGLGAVSYSAAQISGNGLVGVVAAIGAAGAFVAVWSVGVAPKAANGLSQPQKDVIGTVILVLAGVALAVAGQPELAVAFCGVVLANAVVLFVFRKEATNRLKEVAA
jgi:hypothetical protein